MVAGILCGARVVCDNLYLELAEKRRHIPE